MAPIRTLLAHAAAVALSVASLHCKAPGSSPGGPGSSGAPAPTGAPTIPTTAACASLSRLQCARSQHCFLEHVSSAPPRYLCRDKKGPCEEGLSQWDRKACEARAGCEHVAGSCYCPFPGYGDTDVPEPADQRSGGACACGGGAPPKCAVKTGAPGSSAAP